MSDLYGAIVSEERKSSDNDKVMCIEDLKYNVSVRTLFFIHQVNSV